jgi:anti-sigma regulatory factor (Ser/Thr protein kinase)
MVAPVEWRRRCHAMVLPAVAESVCAARRLIRYRTTLWACPHLYDVAAFCVSELVTNAVRHACWPEGASREITVTASIWELGPRMVVTVVDRDERLPVLAAPSFEDWSGAPQCGFGLPAVVELVREAGGDFGFAPLIDQPGKVVYIALPIRDYRR